MNHLSVRSTGATKAAILGSGGVPVYTVFFTYTHAGPGWFRGCLDNETITAGEVQTSVQSKTAAEPPYNFVHIYGCHSSGVPGTPDASLANAFGAGAAGYTDRAYLGWLTDVLDNETGEQWCQIVWANLQSGQSLTDALNNADTDRAPDEYVPGDGDAVWTCFGDMLMTLHNTYYLGDNWHN